MDIEHAVDWNGGHGIGKLALDDAIAAGFRGGVGRVRV